MTYDQAVQHSEPCYPYRWLLRNLTITRDGVLGMYYIKFVAEPGFNGEVINDTTIVFSDKEMVA